MSEQKKINCECCGDLVADPDGENIYDIGFVCGVCLGNAENKTGYCSMHCQLFGTCDESC